MLPYKKLSVPMGFCAKVLYPPATLSLKVFCWMTVRGMKLMHPPIWSDSMSGVVDLVTNTYSIMSAGRISNSKDLVGFSSSATGKRSPLRKVAVQSKGVPRREMWLPSPLLRTMDAPGTRATTSEAFLFGSLAMMSADTMVTTF